MALLPIPRSVSTQIATDVEHLQGCNRAGFDPTGALVCAVRLVGDGVELGVDAARRADGTFAIAGQLGAKLTIAPGTPSETALVSTGGDDGLLATFAF